MPSVTTATLEGLGFPAGRLMQVSALCNLAAPPGDIPKQARGRILMVLGEGWEDQLAACLKLPCSGLIEAAGLSDQGVADLVSRAAGSAFYASFTSHAVNGHHLAGDVVAAITTSHPLSDDTRGAVELALHEAICNAMLHGNLHMKGFEGLSLQALENFGASFRQRLADPDMANRRIEIICSFDGPNLLVDVGDEGRGLDPSLRNESAACGRGFTLIAACCESYELLDNGRHIRMRFPA